MLPDFDYPHIPYVAAIFDGRYAQGVEECLSLLEHSKQLEPAEYLSKPKGTPFYWLGIAAFWSHDYQTATFFFDAAVSEDVDHGRGDDQPAMLFMRLNEKVEQQAAWPIVRKIVAKLQQAIDNYKARSSTNPGALNPDPLEIEDVRRYFLDHSSRSSELRSLTTTFVSFLAEWDYRTRMIDLNQKASKEPFFTHLFRGCLLFESLLKASSVPPPNTRRPTLGDFLTDPRFRQRLGIGQIRVGRDEFEDLLQSLTPNQPLEAAIECTAQARNTLGHNLAWAVQSLNRENYDLLANNISASCLHVISRLYR
jgi:hypothetical protein